MTKKETRGAKKGDNRFKSTQEKNMQAKIELISKSLSVLRKSKVPFEFVTPLAKHVTNIINESEALNKNLSHVTLLRTPEYRVKLEAYLAENSKTPIKSKAASFAYELEIKELKREASILRKCIEKNNIKDMDIKDKLPAPNNNAAQDVNKLCKLIEAIVEATDGSIAIDLDNMTFVKTWLKSKNRTIGTKSMSVPYFKWSVKRGLNNG